MTTYQRISTLLRTIKCSNLRVYTPLVPTSAKILSCDKFVKVNHFSFLRRLILSDSLQRLEGIRKGRLGLPEFGNSSGANVLRFIHNDCTSRQKDIPYYLVGNVNKITLESDLLNELDEEEEDGEEKTMEDDIIDFLNPRLVNFEEMDSSIIIPCPACCNKNEDDPKQEIFIDKNTGYFVCPWCCLDGPWGDLVQLLNSREDTLSRPQLDVYWGGTTDLKECHDGLINDSVFKTIGSDTLRKFSARLSSDETRIVFPLRDERSGDVIGLESVSLLHHSPKIIRRFITGRSQAFSPSLSCCPIEIKNRRRVIVVPTLCDVMYLSKLGYFSLSLPLDDVTALQKHLVDFGATEVILCCATLPPPRHLLLALIKLGVACNIIKTKASDPPIYLRTERQVKESLKRKIPVLSSTTTTFEQIKENVFYRLTHKEETCGVQWRRYKVLNNILLGHRPAELTVLTGPTGSGKTTLISEYSLDLCMQGVTTLWGSFEVSLVRLCEVMLQQYHGQPLPHHKQTFDTIASQFGLLPLHFLTYHGQENIKNVIKAMGDAVRVWGVQHIIIDNLQFMLGVGVSVSGGDRWKEQDATVGALRQFATDTGCHVTVIAHPKKVPDGQPLGISSVFGSAKITQEADNVLILQVNETKTRKILQVVKNRYGGHLGHMNLTFHKDSLTLSQWFKEAKVKSHTERPSEVRQKVLKVRGLET